MHAARSAVGGAGAWAGKGGRLRYTGLKTRPQNGSEARPSVGRRRAGADPRATLPPSPFPRDLERGRRRRPPVALGPGRADAGARRRAVRPPVSLAGVGVARAR